jgi:Ca2+/H+ antiporter
VVRSRNMIIAAWAGRVGLGKHADSPLPLWVMSACGSVARALASTLASTVWAQVLSATHEELDESSTLALSRVVSVLMLVVYGCYLCFQLFTHTHLFEGEDEGDGDDDEERILGAGGAIFWLAVRCVLPPRALPPALPFTIPLLLAGELSHPRATELLCAGDALTGLLLRR